MKKTKVNEILLKIGTGYEIIVEVEDNFRMSIKNIVDNRLEDRGDTTEAK